MPDQAREGADNAQQEALIQRLLRQFEQTLRASFRQSPPNEPHTLEQIEDLVQEIGEQIKERVQKGIADQQGTGDVGKRARCSCGKRARYVALYPRQLVTRHGSLLLFRAYYHCAACKKGFCPLDQQLGLGSGQCSASVVALLARFAAYLSYRKAAQELEIVCGIRLSAGTVQHYARAVGQEIQGDWQAREAKVLHEEVVWEGRPAPRMQVTLDGVLIFVDGLWKEVKLGCVYQPALASGSLEARYCATLSASSSFGRRLRTLGAFAGLDECSQVAVVADGAEWIWQEVGKYYARRVQILDFYHASEHLWDVARAWHGEGSETACAWVKAQQDRLRQDEVDAVLAAIDAWEPVTEEQREIRRLELGYFTAHAQRMRYQTFARAGFHIGSGVAESGCKNVVQGRLKGPGMRWSGAGAEAMLQLRAAWCSSSGADFREMARRAVMAA